MDLNNIVITPSVLADLYSNTLVELPAATDGTGSKSLAQEPAPAEVPVVWRSLGNNQKNILVTVNNPHAVFLADKELNFLTGILTACKLSMDDIALVNLNSIPAATYKELCTHFKSKIVLLFDTEPVAFGLPMSFPQYQLQAFANNTFLHAPSLEQLANDREEKTKLWASLKRLFNL